MHTAKPTPRQLEWHEAELGVIIHYCMEIYDPSVSALVTTDIVRTRLSPDKITPTDLDPEKWVRIAWETGAKYAVLVANHCTGFSLWPTSVNDYSTASLKWKDGKGDIVREFVDACKKYGLKPGLYYSTGRNGYYNISGDTERDYFTDEYQAYARIVERQLTELWTQYGELFEIWFDGGVVPHEEGGPDIVPLLRKHQPDALCFQGPKEHPHNLRWVGTEEGFAPEDCWAATNAGETNYDGTVPDEDAGVGDPDGKYYQPAETDTPNRSLYAFGGGWFWAKDEEHFVRPPEELFDCYLRSVGHNSNLLLGMAISPDGDFKDEEQFRQFGRMIREAFGTPLAEAENSLTLKIPDGARTKYLVLREDIREGQRIREYSVLLNGEEIHAGHSIGHKRILGLKDRSGEISVRVKTAADGWRIRDIAVY